MSLLDRGGLQDQSALEPVASQYGLVSRNCAMSLAGILSHQQPPALTLGTSHPTALLRSLLCSRAKFK